MIANLSLEFQGLRSHALVLVLLGGVLATLIAAGLWQMYRRKWWYGAMCLAVAAGGLPAVVLHKWFGWSATTALAAPLPLIVVLGLHGVREWSRAHRRRGRASLIAAGVLGLTVLAGLPMLLLAGGAGQGAVAMWLVGVCVAMAIGVFYASVFQHLGARRITALMLLRSLSILMLLLVLFKPVVSKAPDIREYKPYLPILVDRSQSMSLPAKAGDGAASRYVKAVEELGYQRDRLAKHFRTEWYHFAKTPNVAEHFAAMQNTVGPAGADTDRTDLAGAVRYVREKISARMMPGILVLSDGVHNAAGADTPLDAAREVGVPLFTVGLGSRDEDAGAKNIEISEVFVPPEVIKNNVTTVKVRVKIKGYPGEPTELRLREKESNVPIATQRLMTTRQGETISVDMKWTPKSLGPGGTESDVSSAVRALVVEVDPRPGEPVTVDNRSEVHVLITEPRLRVLYVEGKMRLEYRFLKRIFDTDPNVQFVSLIRVAENRFWSYGRVDGKKLTNLPTTDADFQMLDVIILGDLDRAFLQPRGALAGGRMAKILEWVKNGGGLLMIGGSKSFGPGGYTNTDIEKALPVLVGPRSQPQEASGFIPTLTALGEKHPIFEGITGFFPGPAGRGVDPKLPKLPDLGGCVTIEKVKDTASLLAVHPTQRNAAGPLVVLATQPFGAGRTAAFSADTTYQWYFSLRGKGVQTPYERFWGQMVRWLAKVDTKSKEAKPSVMLRLDHSYIQVGQSVKITARIQDEKGRAVPDGQATCTIRRADGTGDPVVMPLTPQAGGKLFTEAFEPARHGEYVVKVTATDDAGRALGEDELTLHAQPFSAEMVRVALDDEMLRKMADASGGHYEDAAGLPEMIEHIIERQKRLATPVPLPEQYPLYHFVVLFFLFVALITVEWIVRRAWQLH